jgi:hypothetical protein
MIDEEKIEICFNTEIILNVRQDCKNYSDEQTCCCGNYSGKSAYLVNYNGNDVYNCYFCPINTIPINNQLCQRKSNTTSGIYCSKTETTSIKNSYTVKTLN